ncbi:isocitrate/isopropylmalate dehydrogenase family protein [Mesorhizobium sp. PUT5]|uniref:isocitrate/isopropylmalate dehydrogenase family protein n=1 Tax=Mesorhizobium sp. PUT5 TaxID=3454629 RepID=UPI003FA4B099
MNSYDIAVIHGDGIGPEVCGSAIEVLEAAFGGTSPLIFREWPGGAGHYLETGDGAPEATMQGCERAHAILHGAAGIPGVLKPDGTEAGVDIGLNMRTRLDLYVNIRTVKLLPGVPPRLVGVKPGEIDYRIIRENTEGLYASRGAGAVVRGETAVDMMIMTRKGVERVCRAGFELARKTDGAPADGKRRVTCCDKANVLRSMAFFRSVFDEVAADYPDVEADYSYVDAMTVHLMERPGHYNVIVTENLFGDIISDVGAATVGGMGMSPSAELGNSHGFFQAAHGSAPTIAGQGIANPYGTILSASTMLNWLAERHADGALAEAAARIEMGAAAALRNGVRTRDIGGQASTNEVTQAVISALRRPLRE